MKRILSLLLTLIFIFALSAVAYAGQGGGGLSGSGTYGGNRHGNYSASSNACSRCHSIHNALGADGAVDTGSYKLLRYRAGQQTLFGACNFCHDANGAISSRRVFTKVVPDSSMTTAKHVQGSTTIPDSSDQTNLDRGTVGALDCIDCHKGAPHGVVDGTPVVAGTKLTNVVDPAGAGSTSFCGTCHDRNNKTLPNDISHRVGANFADNSGSGGRQIAGQNATNCASCHTSALKALGGDFPHSADDGGRFLGNSINASSSAGDAGDNRLTSKCFECHRWNPGTGEEGVGLTF